MGLYGRFILPLVLDRAMRRQSLAPQRRDLLAQVEGDVLEIGAGSGLNLPFYPPQVRKLAAVEPHAAMAKKAERRAAAAGIELRTLGLDASQRLPLPDASFDSVVSTWTLCTIPDVAAALREVHRVLKPGGRFFFIEHGLSPDPSVARWQKRMSFLTQRLGGGCHLERDIASILRASPLDVDRCETFYLPGEPRLGGYTYRGSARKA